MFIIVGIASPQHLRLLSTYQTNKNVDIKFSAHDAFLE